ncbi:hypothetical protein N474_12545 [Pseudoalteromonas luteoviolacea CPMOR-2]|uniref:Uncharacterized protein n=1 Tax=Pseudoalteromonas luteoviolacea DSM 6061 TaxID=1365250 RepID=A0A167CDJ7_9GAMM|nr:hypothetical protein [Pseudoalteromonas luteoviolacea]KZN47534.1 hypothetical protein N475_06550 [Pseudoalteromonas luteoviolacea DSM 6061]KZN56102.1 hypothetical protein N474_12545 [Pseudoalteromonas luteoviolacea CPMOR-2]MBE0388570.1 hypothetical protein [Pseudoalteromonas luteoviolacea DSM 6061]
MKILNKQMAKFIVGGDARAPELPDRSQASAQVDCELIDKPAKH